MFSLKSVKINVYICLYLAGNPQNPRFNDNKLRTYSAYLYV